ncbi:hypothetical protein LZ31DRAFT_197646 [Colletotrichum somersetense]|nr:hypothetical protein LZ31DRAFT_197646 [Colletotrichum somersetense]
MVSFLFSFPPRPPPSAEMGELFSFYPGLHGFCFREKRGRGSFPWRRRTPTAAAGSSM